MRYIIAVVIAAVSLSTQAQVNLYACLNKEGSIAQVGTNAPNCGKNGTVISWQAAKQVCGQNQIDCNGVCVDPFSDRKFCGATNLCQGVDKGKTCSNSQTCNFGVCGAPPAQPTMPWTGEGCYNGELCMMVSGKMSAADAASCVANGYNVVPVCPPSDINGFCLVPVPTAAVMAVTTVPIIGLGYTGPSVSLAVAQNVCNAWSGTWYQW